MRNYYCVLILLFIGTILLAKTPTQKQQEDAQKGPSVPLSPTHAKDQRLSNIIKTDLLAAEKEIKKAVEAQEQDSLAESVQAVKHAEQLLHRILNKFE